MSTAAKLILAQKLAFLNTINNALDTIDELHEAQAGTMREGGRLRLETLGDDAWTQHFRFTQAEVTALAEVMELPDPVTADNGAKEDHITALCMLLHRLSYPERLADAALTFGWEKTRYSRISQQVALLLWDRWKHLLRFDPHRLTPAQLATFAEAIHQKGAPLNNVAGFIDGSLFHVARPVFNQRIIFNGWKRYHALKFHVLVGPDGLAMHVYGPVEGIRHDDTMYRQSGLEEILRQHFWTPAGERLFMYGDAAYQLGEHIIVPFKGANLTCEQQDFNAAMSKVRESVEWFFKEKSHIFRYLDYHHNLKVLLQPCGLYYLIGILLCNAHTILHTPQIPRYFNCHPPSLAKYFQGGPVSDQEMDHWVLHSAFAELDEEDEHETSMDDS